MRNLFMAVLLFGGIFIAGAGSNVYAEDGGMLGSGTRSDNGGYYGSGYDNGGGTIGSGTRTGEDNGTGSAGAVSQTVGSGGRIAEPESTTRFSLGSFWEFFF